MVFPFGISVLELFIRFRVRNALRRCRRKTTFCFLWGYFARGSTPQPPRKGQRPLTLVGYARSKLQKRTIKHLVWVQAQLAP